MINNKQIHRDLASRINEATPKIQKWEAIEQPQKKKLSKKSWIILSSSFVSAAVVTAIVLSVYQPWVDHNDLGGSTIEDYTAYQTLGVGVKNEPKTSSGKQYRNIDSIVDTHSLGSSTLFSVVGQRHDGSIQNVVFKGKSGSAVTSRRVLASFEDLGCFYLLGYRDAPSAFSSRGVYHSFANQTIYTLGNGREFYLISKETGSVFNISKQFEPIRTAIYDTGVIFEGHPFVHETSGANLSNYDQNAEPTYYRVNEDRDTGLLSVKALTVKSNMLSDDGPYNNTLLIDRYGNFYLAALNRLLMADDRLIDLSSFADGVGYRYDPFTQLLYHRSAAGEYVYLNANGDMVTYQGTFDNFESYFSYDETVAVQDNGLALFTNENRPYYLLTQDKTTYFVTSKMLYGFTSRGDGVGYDIVTYPLKESEKTPGSAEAPKMYYDNNSIYSFAEGSVYRFHLDTKATNVVSLPEYTISGLGEDGIGNLTVSGYKNADLSTFTGYLDADDTISFETRDIGYSVVYLTPQ